MIRNFFRRFAVCSLVPALLAQPSLARSCADPSPIMVMATRVVHAQRFQEDCLSLPFLDALQRSFTTPPVAKLVLAFEGPGDGPPVPFHFDTVASQSEKNEKASYILFGAGTQAIAAAYDLIVYGKAAKVTLVDSEHASLVKALEHLWKILPLIDYEKIEKQQTAINRENPDIESLVDLIEGHQVVLSCLPYFLNPIVAEAAVKAAVHYCDLGGHLQTTLEIREKFGEAARAAGVALILDLGLAPGLCNALADAGVRLLEKVDDILLYCGGLPQNDSLGPLRYQLIFSLAGLIGNYVDPGFIVRDGKLKKAQPFSERELIQFPGLPEMEAGMTEGATATAPFTLEGKIRNLRYKTVRYPGHYDKVQWLWEQGWFSTEPLSFSQKAVSPFEMATALSKQSLRGTEERLLKELGLLDKDRLDFGKESISPREMFIRAAGEKLNFKEKDLVVLRVIVRGQGKQGPQEVTYNVLDRFDEKTGFTAMQRTTGSMAAIAAAMLGQGKIGKTGFLPIEEAVPGPQIIEAVRKRGIQVQETIENKPFKPTSPEELEKLWTPNDDGKYPPTLLKAGDPAPADIRQVPLFRGLRFVVLEGRRGEAMIYQGNRIQALRRNQNSVDVIYIHEPGAFTRLKDIDPQILMLPHGEKKAEELLHQWKTFRQKDVYADYYTPHRILFDEPEQTINPKRPNLFVGATREVLNVALQSFYEHRSQWKRTLYDVTIESYASATAHLAQWLGMDLNSDYAQKFIVASAEDIIKKDGRWMIQQKHRTNYRAVFLSDPPPEPLPGFVDLVMDGVSVVNSPHADDRVIASGLMDRQMLEHGNDVIEIVHGSGHAGLLTTWAHLIKAGFWFLVHLPRFWRQLRRTTSIWHIEERLFAWRSAIRDAKARGEWPVRRREAVRSAERLAEGTRGSTEVRYLSSDLMVDDNGDPRTKEIIQTVYEEHLRGLLKHLAWEQKTGHHAPFKIRLAHPEDSHRSHVDQTQCDYAAIVRLREEFATTDIKLIHFIAPWYGDENFYFQSQENIEEPAEDRLLHRVVAQSKKGLAPLTSELTQARFGGKSHDMARMGGPYAESSRRERVYWDDAAAERRKDNARKIRNFFIQPPRNYQSVFIDRVMLPIEQALVALWNRRIPFGAAIAPIVIASGVTWFLPARPQQHITQTSA